MGAETAVLPSLTQQQQLQNLTALQKALHLDSNGIHDSEAVMTRQEHRSPYAFDLGRAWELAQAKGERYRASFIADTRYYLKECYGKVPHTDYYHEVRRDAQDNVTLYLGYGEKARDSYTTPAKDGSLPTWYRERARRDGDAIKDLEEALSHATGEDIFIDISPAQFDMFGSLDELKQWHFGVHSFVRIHRIVEENGKERLASRGVRVYLGPEELRTLFEEATGKKAPDDLLGSITKITADRTPGWIQQRAQELYDRTPKDRKIKPLDDGVFREDAEMNMILDLPFFAQWQERILAQMLQRPPSEQGAELLQDAIEKEFHGLEMALRDFLKGTLTLQQIHAPVRDSRVGSVDVRSMMPHGLMSHYVNNVEYKAPGACDGNGSGRRRKNGLTTPALNTSGFELMIYGNMTLDELLDDEEEGFECPGCGGWIPWGSGNNCPNCPMTKQKWKDEGHEVC